MGCCTIDGIVDGTTIACTDGNTDCWCSAALGCTVDSTVDAVDGIDCNLSRPFEF